MKKIFFLVTIIGIVVFVSILLIFFLGKNKGTIEKNPLFSYRACIVEDRGLVAILLDEKTYTALFPEIDRFANDIANDLGVETKIFYRLWVSALEVRNILNSLYAKENLIGVVLVGDIPKVYDVSGGIFAAAGGYSTVLTDLYYTYTETNHTWKGSLTPPNNCAFSVLCVPPIAGRDFYFSSGNVPDFSKVYGKPRIFIGRISPPVAPETQEYYALLKQYLERNHAYRNGEYTYDGMLIYVPFENFPEKDRPCKDGKECAQRGKDYYLPSGIGEEKNLKVIMGYQDDAYFNELKNHRYAFVAYNGHGSGTFQEGNITAEKIKQAKPRAAFYQFLSCSIGKFDEGEENIGNAYLFYGETLAVWGSTIPIFSGSPVGAGGHHESIYGAVALLASGAPFYQAVEGDIVALSPVILGDPTISLKPKIRKNCTLEFFQKEIKEHKKYMIDDVTQYNPIEIEVTNKGQDTCEIRYILSHYMHDTNMWVSKESPKLLKAKSNFTIAPGQSTLLTPSVVFDIESFPEVPTQLDRLGGKTEGQTCMEIVTNGFPPIVNIPVSSQFIKVSQ